MEILKNILLSLLYISGIVFFGVLIFSVLYAIFKIIRERND